MSSGPIVSKCPATFSLTPAIRSRYRSPRACITAAIDCIGVIALIASALTISFASCGWLAIFAAAICCVQPSRFARASTVPSGTFTFGAISRRPIPARVSRANFGPCGFCDNAFHHVILMPVTRFSESARQRFGYTFLRSRVAVSVSSKHQEFVLLRNQSAARSRADQLTCRTATVSRPSTHIDWLLRIWSILEESFFTVPGSDELIQVLDIRIGIAAGVCLG